jgi:hypothetical protein
MMVVMVQSVRNYSSKILVLDNRMLAQYFSAVHLHHSLHTDIFTVVTFCQEAAPLMLVRTGEDSAKGTLFFTSIMNLMQFMYIYSSAYFSTNVT